MLSIGQFSKVCCVSVKTLRHYEKIGLLLPSHVDGWTGYRHYDERLIPTMLLIQRLKRYGFSLQEIGRIIEDGPDGRQALAALRRQRSVLEAQMEQTAVTLRELERHLSSFERTGNIMEYQNFYEIAIQELPERWILSTRQHMSVEEYGRYYGKLYERVARSHIAVDGSVLSIYHDAEFDPERSDIELALGVKDPKQATRALPGGLAVTTTHRGPYSGLADAYGALMRWITAEGYEVIQAPYENYRNTQFDGVPPEQWETDIVFPVRKREEAQR